MVHEHSGGGGATSAHRPWPSHAPTVPTSDSGCLLLLEVRPRGLAACRPVRPRGTTSGPCGRPARQEPLGGPGGPYEPLGPDGPREPLGARWHCEPLGPGKFSSSRWQYKASGARSVWPLRALLGARWQCKPLAVQSSRGGQVAKRASGARVGPREPQGGQVAHIRASGGHPEVAHARGSGL